MDLVNMLNNSDYVSRFVFDVFNHASSGYLLAESFFPESNFAKKGIRALVAGFLPDVDYLIPFLDHRGLTHGWAAPFLPLVYSLFEKEKGRAILFSGLCVASHLVIDSFDGFEEHIPYTVGVSSLLTINYLKKHNYFQKIFS